MRELVDVIDQRGRFLRTASRSEAHRRRLLHRGIRVLLFNRNGDVFVQQRSHTKDVNPGLWEGSLAGHVRHGEHPLRAAMRETREEVGLRVSPRRFRLIGHYLTPTVKDRMRYTLYLVKKVDKAPKLDPVEVLQGHWESPGLITRHVKAHPHKYTPGFRKAWRLFCKNC